VGEPWVLREWAHPPDDELGYTCVSYAWGDQRVQHILDPGGDMEMSSRTIAVAEAVVRARRPARMWLDALCVPLVEPARTACLRRMGETFAHASEVVVVLSPSSARMLEALRASEGARTEALLSFEQDKWITRAWTYPELANCNAVFFAADNDSDPPVHVEQVLLSVSSALYEHQKRRGGGGLHPHTVFPCLDSLENLTLSWKTTENPIRSAYTVMCGMRGRESAAPEDHFYAMASALAAGPLTDDDLAAAPPGEYFMRLCESVGDFSFVFSTAPRDPASGRGWRPMVVDRLEPILSWPTERQRQRAVVNPTCLQLHDMWVAPRGSVSAEATELAEHRLRLKPASDGAHGSLPRRILQCLRDAGFRGCGHSMELAEGFF